MHDHDPDDEDIALGKILELTFEQSGFDFSDYSMRFIKRRISAFASAKRLSSLSELLARLAGSIELTDALVNFLTIHTTSMFRDPDFYKSFRKHVCPFLATYPSIRLWHAGCSSGEEVYSMAILLKEAGLYERATIYATDINLLAVNAAMKGILSLTAVKQYTENYYRAGGQKSFSDYYATTNGVAVVIEDLKQNIVFAQHNLCTDRSFNEFQAVICRNVLIYFNKPLQERSLELFHQSLGNGGFLALGDKETPNFTRWSEDFHCVDSRWKLFQKR